ncbi:MAG: hypothetical protein MJ192_00940 [Clostridia bacterium]|nr:hypothetical protein [Clostridia bacterium]
MRRIPTENEIPVTLDLQDERATAFGRACCFMRQAYPNMALMTYDNRVGRGAEHLVLCKLVVGIGTGDAREWLTYEACTDETTADNIPGGLHSRTVTESGHTVFADIFPAALPEQDRYRGAAVVHLHSDAPGLCVRFGCGNIAFMHHSPNAVMKGPDIDCEEGAAVLSGNGQTVTITHTDRDFFTCVRGGFEFRVIEKAPSGSFAEGYTDASDAFLMLGFSTDADEALYLASLDPDDEIRKVRAYYDRMFRELWIHTPDPELDEAFTHAYLNLSYSWLYPLGWIECIQHWPTMFHMEQTAAEEWAGHASRTRDTLLSQLGFMTKEGCIIELNPNHTARRDWGGDNHFFFREALHYIRQTNDLDFARTIEPHMDKILAQTFGEYDAVGTGVLAWHSQIGNQEDFESTPGHGAAPGSVGVQMLREAGELYRILADADGNDAFRDKSAQYDAWADYCLGQWKKHLWKRDLGRAVWFTDDYGETRLDTTYHGICYPVMFGQVDSFDAQSSLDHLLHRMTGHEGEVFQSNHFGDHYYEWVPTWGMQAGSNMQAFATAAYAAVGKHEDAVRPLDFVARRVCGPYQRGSFPETANEKRFGYFSPSAGVYAQAVIESLFGLSLDRTQGTLTVSPCFPAAWDHAQLHLPDYDYQYEKTADGFTLTLHADVPVRKTLVWRTDLLRSASVTVNGVAAASSLTSECGFSVLTCELGCNSDVTVTVRTVPLGATVSCAPFAVCGEPLTVSVTGGELIGIDDRCGVLDESGCVRTDLLDEYDKYGDFGLVNFARRTVAARVRVGDVTALIPVSFTVLPRLVFSASYDANKHIVRLSVRSHLPREIGNASLLLRSGSVTASARLSVPAGGTASVDIPYAGIPVPGKNRAALHVDGVFDGEVTFDAPLDESPEKLPLPADMIMPYAGWRGIAYFPHHGCTVINPDIFLVDMPESVTVDGLTFPLAGGFLPVATRTNRMLTIPVDRDARKLYVLFCAMADDHEICTPLFDAEIGCEKGSAYLPPLYRKTLYFPGDFDYGFANGPVVQFSTHTPDTVRPSVLPPLAEDDYAETVPPLYPVRTLWCRNRAAEAGNAVFNLLEFDLGVTRRINTLTFIARASDAAGGVFGITYV